MKKIIWIIIGIVFTLSGYISADSKEDIINELTNEIARITDENKIILEQKDKEIKDLTTRYNFLTTNNNGLKSDIERYKNNVSKLTEEKKQLKNEKTELINEANEKIRKLNAMVGELEGENILLKGENKRLEAQLKLSDNSPIVYWNGGKSSSNKYHKSANAHGMKGAVKMTENEAKASGYIACQSCW